MHTYRGGVSAPPNAIKFYFEKILGGRRKLYFVERPHKEKALPVVCSEEEIGQFLTSVENIKHPAILSTIYSGGRFEGLFCGWRVDTPDSSPALSVVPIS